MFRFREWRGNDPPGRRHARAQKPHWTRSLPRSLPAALQVRSWRLRSWHSPRRQRNEAAAFPLAQRRQRGMGPLAWPLREALRRWRGSVDRLHFRPHPPGLPQSAPPPTSPCKGETRFVFQRALLFRGGGQQSRAREKGRGGGKVYLRSCSVFLSYPNLTGGLVGWIF